MKTGWHTTGIYEFLGCQDPYHFHQSPVYNKDNERSAKFGNNCVIVCIPLIYLYHSLAMFTSWLPT